MNFFGIKTKKQKQKQKPRTKKFKKMNCSPFVEKERIRPDSCFTEKTFMTILKKYNEKHPNDPIPTKNLKKAWSIMKERLSRIWCVRQQSNCIRITRSAGHYLIIIIIVLFTIAHKSVFYRLEHC